MRASTEDRQDRPRALARELISQISLLPAPNTRAVRTARREISRKIARMTPQFVRQLASCLLSEQSGRLRWVAYELLSHHKQTFEQLRADDLVQLGEGIASWSSVDCFGLCLSGPTWAQRRVPDKTITAWARSDDRWWRRAALVSTVALSRRGRAEDIARVTRICLLLARDRDDMVVKAVSWALRELAKKQPQAVRSFLAEHRGLLAARVIREVKNKLRTGLKNPRAVRTQASGIIQRPRS
jgi:3-methyladenine DNA glycosylase AlkD